MAHNCGDPVCLANDLAATRQELEGVKENEKKWRDDANTLLTVRDLLQEKIKCLEKENSRFLKSPKCFWVFGHRWSKWQRLYGNTVWYQTQECLDCGRLRGRGAP